MAIGKYVTNIGVIGAALGALGTARQTQAMPKDWRRGVVWAVWAAGLALAIAGVSMQQPDPDLDDEDRERQHESKRAAKSVKRARRQL